jgi:hypothetical protein
MANDPITRDTEFEKRLVDECVREVCSFKNWKDMEYKDFKNVMKKYETLVYDKYVKNLYVKAADIKDNTPPDFILQQVKFPFVADANYQFGKLKVMKNMQDDPSFIQQNPNWTKPFPDPFANANFNQTGQQPLPFGKNYSDINGTTKFHHPSEDDMPLFNWNIYPNKPINDITNQQLMYQRNQPTGLNPPPSFGSTGGLNPPPNFGATGFNQTLSGFANFANSTQGTFQSYSPNYSPLLNNPNNSPAIPNNFGGPSMPPQFDLKVMPVPNGMPMSGPNSFGLQNVINKPLLGGGAFQNNLVPEYDPNRVMRLIEQSGGLDKTLPQMEKSLWDNEVRYLDPQFKANFMQNTSNTRLKMLFDNSQLPPRPNSGPQGMSPGRDPRQVEREEFESRLEARLNNFARQTLGSREGSRERSLSGNKKMLSNIKDIRKGKEEVLNMQVHL